jgi:outer membrane protein OmpA-like peptidoglycan-associated protein
VRDETRGTVITLTGKFLFPSGKTILLPAARQKLNQIAEVVKAQRDRRIVVESRIDATPDPKKEVAAQERADAVRDYLIMRGVADDRILAKALASPAFIDDRTGAHRGVEIVIEQASVKE